MAMAAPFVNPPGRQDPEASPAAGESKSKPGMGLAGRRVLIVEDEAMISALIQMIIGEAGCSIVGPVATLERALDIELSGSPLCVNNRDVYALADVLSTRGIPIIFLSGYARPQLPPSYQHRPYIAKPFTPDTILIRLDEVIAGNGS